MYGMAGFFALLGSVYAHPPICLCSGLSLQVGFVWELSYQADGLWKIPLPRREVRFYRKQILRGVGNPFMGNQITA